MNNIGKYIGYFGLLSILCIISFLVAKYIVRNKVNWEDNIVDVSEKYNQ